MHRHKAQKEETLAAQLLRPRIALQQKQTKKTETSLTPPGSVSLLNVKVYNCTCKLQVLIRKGCGKKLFFLHNGQYKVQISVRLNGERCLHINILKKQHEQESSKTLKKQVNYT